MEGRALPATPRVLCVGGLDASGRAGLLADAWAVLRAGAQPLAAATALTAQGGRRFSLNPVAPAVLRAQLEAARASGPVHAVKLGMVATPGQLEVVVRALEGLAVPWVVDPVTATSRGERLSRLAPRHYQSLGRAVGGWITPNADELEWLTGDDSTPAARWQAITAPGRRLLESGWAFVFLKGGDSARDVLFTQRGQRVFGSTPLRRDRVVHRGTGCRLASALAARLAAGAPADEAVEFARRLVRRFLRAPIVRARF